MEMKKKIKRWIRNIVLLVLFCVVSFVCIIGYSNKKNQDFKETFYQLSSDKVDERIRVLQLGDLHNSSFGADNEKLLHRVSGLRPDLIVISGDMADKNDESDHVAVELCKKLTELAPVYYAYGNHESAKYLGMEMMEKEDLDQLFHVTPDQRSEADPAGLEDGLREELEAAGVHVLQNAMDTLNVRNTTIDIYGVLTTMPGAFWDFAGKSYSEFIYTDSENLKLLVCHEPYIFETYPEGIEQGYWADVVMSGHRHGGVVRVPRLGGLYAYDRGFLPEFRSSELCMVYGQYDLGGAPAIVTSGLTNRGITRVHNQPELVIIDINRY